MFLCFGEKTIFMTVQHGPEIRETNGVQHSRVNDCYSLRLLPHQALITSLTAETVFAVGSLVSYVLSWGPSWLLDLAEVINKRIIDTG